MEQILEERRIDTLFHFTQVNNLENIFHYGLLPRSVLTEQKIDSSFNDGYRYDNCIDAVCVSIEFPNYKMFYGLRVENPDIDWAVLKLDAHILCDFTCAYCWSNAGSAVMYNTPIEERMGREAFLELFDDRQGYPQREQLQIEPWYPTNPQAEVLVFETIPIEYIQGVYFNSNKALQHNIGIIPNDIDVMCNSNFFRCRKDYEFWRN